MDGVYHELISGGCRLEARASGQLVCCEGLFQVAGGRLHAVFISGRSGKPAPWPQLTGALMMLRRMPPSWSHGPQGYSTALELDFNTGVLWGHGLHSIALGVSSVQTGTLSSSAVSPAPGT